MKKIKIAFSVLCLLLCVLPFAAMSFAKTEATTENRKLSKMPALYSSEQGFNVKYLQQLGTYFEDHFAGRNLMVNIDSLIQGKLFKVSNAKTVIKGENGWLFYTDTIDDYLATALLSDREIYNMSRNISIMQQYIASKGAKFAFTVAPNKNSLYDENMPYYYSKKACDKKNIDALAPLLKENNINYVDLFSLFDSQKETLYLKRDSHWNNKGAMLAYSSIMNELKLSPIDYSTVKAIREKKEIGDLNKMLYPLTAKPEWNYYYQFDSEFKFDKGTKSVEDAWIKTTSDAVGGTLLMFRDSFGNTLLPFFARDFKTSYFSKAMPYLMESYIEQYSPDFIVAEKVERNIDEFVLEPPVLTALSDHKIKKNAEKVDPCAESEITSYSGSADYYVLNGTINEDVLKTDSDIYVKIGDSVYSAYGIGDNGFRLYLKKTAVDGKNDVSVVVSSGDKEYIVKTETVDFGAID